MPVNLKKPAGTGLNTLSGLQISRNALAVSEGDPLSNSVLPLGRVNVECY